MQQIWSLNIDWDDAVPDEIATKWNKVREQMYILSDIRINRWIGSDKNTPIELIGFCDACTKAYAAVIYTRVTRNSKKYVQFLTSKTRVAPMKTITLSRLELCGALSPFVDANGILRVGGRLRAVRAYIHKCVKCHRFGAKATQQMMGNLPC